jgi:AcrR family transcriptional regulator
MQTLKEEVKNNIIEAAVKEFTLAGYEKASMRTIAKDAGISVSNTYNYYPNKAQLFESIIEPVYLQLKNNFKISIEQSMKKGLEDNITLTFIRGIVDMLMQMEARQRQLFIVLAEKSTGTKYEKAREEMTGLLRMHLAEVVRKPGSAPRIEEGQAFILTIIAANYIDGILKILKDYRSKEWAEDNLRTLLTYHLNGIKALAV